MRIFIHGIVAGLLGGGGASALLILLFSDKVEMNFSPGMLPLGVIGVCLIFMIIFAFLYTLFLRGFFLTYLASLALFFLYSLFLDTHRILPVNLQTLVAIAIGFLPAIYYLHAVLELSLPPIPPQRRAEEFRDLGEELPHPHPS